MIVADGMGGHAGGEIASRLAVETVEQALQAALRNLQLPVLSPSPAAEQTDMTTHKLPETLSHEQDLVVAEVLHNAVHATQAVIRAAALAQPEATGDAGCTLTVALATGDRVHIAHVGDSHAYLWRPSALHQLRPRPLAAALLVAAGADTAAEARHHPERSTLYQFLGITGKPLVIEFLREPLAAGDLLLLCSDGLWGMLRDEEIATLAGRERRWPRLPRFDRRGQCQRWRRQYRCRPGTVLDKEYWVIDRSRKDHRHLYGVPTADITAASRANVEPSPMCLSNVCWGKVVLVMCIWRPIRVGSVMRSSRVSTFPRMPSCSWAKRWLCNECSATPTWPRSLKLLPNNQLGKRLRISLSQWSMSRADRWRNCLTNVCARDAAPLPKVRSAVGSASFCRFSITRTSARLLVRDIKPGNIMLLPDSRTIKLIDFGIVKIGRAGMKTQRGALGVSPGFSPPEQYAKAGTTDAPSDLYAVGATMYCLLTGQVPAEATSIISGVEQLIDPRQHIPSLSPQIGAVILKAMSINMADRYQTASEMLAALHGQSAPLNKPCPHCGHAMKVNPRFCPACGKASGQSQNNTVRMAQVEQPGFVVVNGKEIRNMRQLVDWCDANWRDAVQTVAPRGALVDICQHFSKQGGGLFGRGSEDWSAMLIKVQQTHGLPDDNIALEMALRALGAKTPGYKHNWGEVESKLGLGIWPDPRCGSHPGGKAPR